VPKAKKPARPTAFIIYGRDLQARDSMAAFLEAVGLTVIPFAHRSLGLGTSPFIAEIVLAALKQADVLVALFTPDEQAALYDPKSSRLEIAESRWQARQNVIFEAGVAFGLHREKTILVTMGADVRLFSDLSGVHFVEILKPGGGELLFHKLTAIVPGLRSRVPSKTLHFKSKARGRWAYYDDVEILLASIGACCLGKGKHETTLLDVMRRVVGEETRWSWTTQPRPRTLMNAIARKFTATVTNEAYWWLVVYGILQFDNIEQFYEGDGDDWDESVDYCVFAPRAVALWERLRNVAC
jgi:hypothetical protein